MGRVVDRTTRAGASARAVRAAALVTALPAMLLAAGCGASSDKAEPSPSATTSASPSASALERAVLAQGDVKGFQVTDQEIAGSVSGKPESDKPSCQALAHLTGDKPSPTAKETVRRGLLATGTADSGSAVVAGLNSHTAKGDAVKALDAIRTAVGKCASGFVVTVQGTKVTYTKVKSQTAVKGGDDAVHFTMTVELGGRKLPMDIVVVRDGSTLAHFVGVDFTTMKPYAVPQAVVKAQLAKLDKAAGQSGVTRRWRRSSRTG